MEKMTESIQETRMREAMEPLGEILGNLQIVIKQGTFSQIFAIVLISGIGGITFKEEAHFITKRIFLFALLLILLAVLAYFEWQNIKKIKSAYQRIEKEPYETKSDLIRSKEIIENILSVLYPKYANLFAFFIGFNAPFIFLRDYLFSGENNLAFSLSRFWENPIFILVTCVTFGLLMVWASLKNTKKQKDEQYLQQLVQLQWIIDNYDKPS